MTCLFPTGKPAVIREDIKIEPKSKDGIISVTTTKSRKLSFPDSQPINVYDLSTFPRPTQRVIWYGVPYIRKPAYPLLLEIAFWVYNRYSTLCKITRSSIRTKYSHPVPGTIRNSSTWREIIPSGSQGIFRVRCPNSRRICKVRMTTRYNQI